MANRLTLVTVFVRSADDADDLVIAMDDDGDYLDEAATGACKTCDLLLAGLSIT